MSRFRLTVPVLLGFAFVAWSGLSLLWSSDPRHGALALVYMAGLWLVFCFVASGAFDKWLLRVIVVAYAGALAMLAIWPETHGVFGNMNWAGEWLMIAWPFVAAWGLRQKDNLWLIATALLLVALAYLLFWSTSEAWAVVLAVVALVYLARHRYWFGFTIVALAVFDAVMLWPEVFQAAALARLEFWINTTAMWLDAPRLFLRRYPDYRRMNYHKYFLTVRFLMGSQGLFPITYGVTVSFGFMILL